MKSRHSSHLNSNDDATDDGYGTIEAEYRYEVEHFNSATICTSLKVKLF